MREATQHARNDIVEVGKKNLKSPQAVLTWELMCDVRVFVCVLKQVMEFSRVC